MGYPLINTSGHFLHAVRNSKPQKPHKEIQRKTSHQHKVQKPKSHKFVTHKQTETEVQISPIKSISAFHIIILVFGKNNVLA